MAPWFFSMNPLWPGAYITFSLSVAREYDSAQNNLLYKPRRDNVVQRKTNISAMKLLAFLY